MITINKKNGESSIWKPSQDKKFKFTPKERKKRVDEYDEKIENLKEEKKIVKKYQHKKEYLEIEIQKEDKLLKTQEEIENEEFKQLVTEMIPLNFTKSSQVSSYIIKKKLGNKYKNISGILTMEKEGRPWDYKGGISPKFYAKLCSELKLGNNGSFTSVAGFKSFKELNK